MTSIYRGYHPFDQGVSTWNTYHELFGSDTFYNKEVVHANLSQVHVPFDLNERSAKERIKAGAIHFDPGRWINLDDGTPLTMIIPSISPAIHYLRLPTHLPQ